MKIEEKAIFPRPDFIRTNYISLNGEWNFDFDDSEIFDYKNIDLSKKITVPFPYQSEASGINDSEYHPVMWYERKFEISEDNTDKAAILKFGAVDHKTDVWINSVFIGSHTGGYTSFEFEISDFLKPGKNYITVRVEDRNDPSYLRGKQIWEGKPEGCFYTAISGIWQDVWIEFTDKNYISAMTFDTDFDSNRVDICLSFNRNITGTVEIIAENENCDTFVMIQTVKGNKAKCSINLPDLSIKDKKINWSPANPNLFDVKAVLKSGNGLSDTVYGYFGIRKFEAKGDKLYLNNSQYYLRTVLNQGYWNEGIYRPLSGDEYKKDIELALECGFNCMRMHQKIEDPKFYYYADILGLLIWEELPSFFEFSDSACEETVKTLTDSIKRDKNHPCIITRVIFNESWGLRKYIEDKRQQSFAKSLYNLSHCLDLKTPVSTNDGWENPEETDIIAIHDYRTFTDGMVEYYSDINNLENGSARTGHPYMIPGNKYKGQPVLITEFAGKRLDESLFGEERSYKLIEELRNDVEKILKIKNLSGYCITQLFDTYQEVNGLFDMNRNPKAEIEEYRKIFSAKPAL